MESTSPSPQPARKKKVLIVEDEALVARDLERSLSAMGYEVIGPASSYEEALQAAENKRPDIVLMDIRIGAPDGIETAMELRRLHHVPVIYLTAHADEQTVARAALTEPYAYVIKPFTTSDVRAAIEIALFKHQADAAAAKRERWFSTTLRSIDEGVIACDPRATVQLMNRAAETLTGWNEQDAKGRPVREVFQLSSASQGPIDPVAEALHARAVRRVPKDTRLIERETQRARWIDDSVSPIVHDDELLGAVLVFRDVTEQRRLQEQAALAERLSSLGAIAGSVLHEVNNPLAYNIANLTFALANLKDLQARAGNGRSEQIVTEVIEALDDAWDGAQRIAGIVSELRALSRSIYDAPTETDVKASLEWAIRMTLGKVRDAARLVKELEPVPTVLANGVRLTQVFVTLLDNAASAIVGPSDANEVRVRLRVDGAHVVVEVSDTAPAIPLDVLPRIFDHGFATKAHRGGGLGLASCRDIAIAFGGDLTAETERGRGNTFRLRLPAKEATHDKDAADTPEQRAKVILIDDEPHLRTVMQRLLEQTHDVTTFAAAADALDTIRAGTIVDVIVCDLVMPGMSGSEFYRALQRELPELASRVVFITGGVFLDDTMRFLGATKRPVLRKPFDADALLRTIDDVLRAKN